MKVFSTETRPRYTGAGRACVRNTVKHSQCSACEEVCPTGAFTLTAEGRMEINPHACIGCGYCLFNCPVDAVEGIAPAQRHYRDNRLVPPFSPVAPCTEELLMWHSEYGIRLVEMEPDTASVWFQAVATLNVRLRQMGEPLWNIVPPSPQTLNGSRRHWLHLKNAGDFTGCVTPGRRFRRSRLTQVSEYSPELDQSRCTLCGACARICPEEAIRFDDLSMTLDPVKCTGCGNCEAVCFDRALSVRENRESTIRILRIEQARCGVCRRDYIAWTEEENACPVCRRHTFGMREA